MVELTDIVYTLNQQFAWESQLAKNRGSQPGVRVPLGVCGGLAEAKVTCNGATMLSVCVVHKGEKSFCNTIKFTKKHSCQANNQCY